ncbi:MAG: hypothetical protein R3F61_13705 [Myxococcota bacterium]
MGPECRGSLDRDEADHLIPVHETRSEHHIVAAARDQARRVPLRWRLESTAPRPRQQVGDFGRIDGVPGGNVAEIATPWRDGHGLPPGLREV